ncbi:hypothetical protein V5740_07030 [Croceibacterium sp. TMG7-5b_MA50]|uniref:hypothetical protein n=1 Tax=Croceibacterium sp. TMG7-5b_MA50 TaxID=3121290 RepID=UPI0032215BE3
MTDPVTFNRIDWFTAFWALCVWFAHFMLVWSASVIWPVGPIGRIVALGLTLVALAVNGWLWRRVRPVSIRSVAGLGLAIATVAISFSTVPALIG